VYFALRQTNRDNLIAALYRTTINSQKDNAMRLLLKSTIMTAALVLTLDVSASPGDLDLGFGPHTGWIRIPDSNPVATLIQQKDGKLVSAGTCNSLNKKPGFCLQRFNSNGTLDTSFNATGRVVTNINAEAAAYTLLQQPDGKLLAAGSSSSGAGSTDIALVRYNNDGSLDNTFGTNGIAVDIFNEGWDIAIANRIVRLDDGKLLVAGYKASLGQTSHHILLSRYNADGSLDTTFNNTGKVVTTVDTKDSAQALLVQNNGKLLIGGYAYDRYNNYSFMLARYEPDGSPDNAFGTNGIVKTRIDQNAMVNDIIEQDDGKIVAVGNGNSAKSITVARYNMDGSLDTAFNGNGYKNLSDWETYGHMIYQQPDGKLLVLGKQQYSTADFTLVMAQFNTDGTMDTRFGVSGVVKSRASGMNASISAVLRQADNKIVAIGPGVEKHSVIARFLNDPFEHSGTDELDALGTAVTTADMNNDGTDDVIVSSPLVDTTRYNFPESGSGSVSLKTTAGYHADSVIDTGIFPAIIKNAGSIRILSGKDFSLLYTLTGINKNQRFGIAIAAVADQTGDGKPDLLVGEPNALLGRGRVRLYSGNSGKPIKTIASGTITGQQFGKAISLGDVNNDAVADLVIGVPGAKQVLVYDGSTLFTSTKPQRLYLRKGSGNRFGSAVAVDNQHRLLVGSPADHAGTVEVFNGSEGNSPPLFVLTGTDKGEKFGSAISVIASNGHWLVGAPHANASSVINGIVTTKKAAGKVAAFSSIDASLLSKQFGNATGDNFGAAVNASADMDNDGTSDLVVGAPASDVSGPVYSNYELRKKAGRVSILSGAKTLTP
jgi:uncharacterized delta-60 repeat protein